MVTLSGVVLLLGLAAAFVTATAAAHRRAQSAADLAALAGAVARQRGEDACTGAADVARRNGAELVVCEVLDDDVRVAVRVPEPRAGRARVGGARPGARRSGLTEWRQWSHQPHWSRGCCRTRRR